MFRFPIVILVLLAGLVACNDDDEAPPDAGETATTPGPTETIGTSVTPSPTEGGLPAGWAVCVDEDQGYEIGYPEEWYSGAENLKDECRLFDPEPFDVEPQTEPPVTAMMVRPTMVGFERVAEEWFNDEMYDVAIQESTTIAGRDAFRYERTQREDILYPEGTTYYGYLIDHQGDAFFVQTVEIPNGDKERDRPREVVDRAVETLNFSPL